MLGVAVCAVLAGARSSLAVAEWARDLTPRGESVSYGRRAARDATARHLRWPGARRAIAPGRETGTGPEQSDRETIRLAEPRTGTAGLRDVARTLGIVTLHPEELKTEVGVRELHDQLSRYLRHVDAGGEVMITMRGRRVARLSTVTGVDPLADLRARGLVRDPLRPRRRARGRQQLVADGSVSDLVGEQRR